MQEWEYFSPIFSTSAAWFVNVENVVPISSLDDLRGKGLTLCTPLGAANSDALESMIRKGELERYRPLRWEACFRMLSRGRVDVVGQPEATGLWHIKNSGG